MYRIMIAEDDHDIAELMQLYLSSEENDIILAENGQVAWDIFQQEQIHLLIVDIMMPVMNGNELIKKVRSQSNVPIIIVSAKGTNLDKIIGFNIGADMYLTKPFDPMELLATTKAALRRYYQFGGAENSSAVTTIYRYKDLVLDAKSMTVKLGESTLSLTATEIRILSLLMQNPGKVFTREQIAESIRSDFFESDAKTIAVHVSNLRKKMNDNSATPQYIKSVRGLGYKLDKE